MRDRKESIRRGEPDLRRNEKTAFTTGWKTTESIAHFPIARQGGYN